MASGNLALFRSFPALRSRLARCAFVEVPTPVEPLGLPGLPEGGLWVKRDDLSCPLYGGNKPRKLEFLIGRALERRSRRLVTSGALGTHHGLATTILGHSVGLATTLVLVPQPLTAEVESNLARDEAEGAEVVRTSGVAGAVAQSLRVLCRSQLRGERPHFIWAGGSTSRGNLGFVSAGLELAEQIAASALPVPAEIDVAVGSGGTLAGLVLGLRLAGLNIPVRGVVVNDILAPTPRALARSARATLALMQRLDPMVPTPSLTPDDFPLDRSELGGGYGVVTPAAVAAQRRAADCGLELDLTYTAKCLAAVLARADRNALPDGHGPILFWNTHSSAKPPSPWSPSATSRAPAGPPR